MKDMTIGSHALQLCLANGRFGGFLFCGSENKERLGTLRNSHEMMTCWPHQKITLPSVQSRCSSLNWLSLKLGGEAVVSGCYLLVKKTCQHRPSMLQRLTRRSF